jgi:hypothetical protein
MGCISDRREKTIVQTQVGVHMTKEQQTQDKDGDGTSGMAFG